MKKYYLEKLAPDDKTALYKRPAIDFESVFETVKGVIKQVKLRRDDALREYTLKFDKVDLTDFQVSPEEIEEACKRIPIKLQSAFKTAAKNIETFHRESFAGYQTKLPNIQTMPGVKCFFRYTPVSKVGLYIPGGTAPLPSTVLMLAIPAKIAGCEDIVMCTPPQKDGTVSDIILFAAKLAGVTKIYKVGGAQAIAAMAFGTESIPKVFKICGPGNQYVTAAKMLVSIDKDGSSIDMPAGPSEVLVIADGNTRADFVAADLLSQAEHGTDSQVVLVCTDDKKVDEILEEVEKQLNELPRKDITSKALESSFALIVTTLEEAIDFANQYAPEHLILNFKDAQNYVDRIKNAGSVFIGPLSCESAGDYASGTNHSLPTYGYAKMCSGVSADTFVKKVTFQELDQEGVKNLGPTVAEMAECEGLEAHKNAMQLRYQIINQ